MSTDQMDLFGGTASPPVDCPTCGGIGKIDPTKLAETLERPGQTGSAHPSTSRTAGTTPRKGSQRHEALRVLQQCEGRGATAYRVSQLIAKSPNQTAARLGELHDDLFVTYLRDDSGAIVEAETTPGNTGYVHHITSLGLMTLREIER